MNAPANAGAPALQEEVSEFMDKTHQHLVKSIEGITGDLQQISRTIWGYKDYAGALERLRNLETAETDNQKMRDEWKELKAQFRGAQRVIIVAAVVLGALGAGGFAALWKTLGEIAKALP